MSLLDNPENNTDATDGKYTFMSKGISDFVGEYRQKKQEQPISDNIYDDFPEDTEEIQEETTEELPRKLQASASVARATAKILTTTLDSAMSGIFGFISKGDASDFKADEDQRDDLETAFAEYVKLKGGDIPPGIALLLLVVSIYGTKIPMAIQLRKYNTEKEALLQRAERAEKQLLEFQKGNKIENPQ